MTPAAIQCKPSSAPGTGTKPNPAPRERVPDDDAIRCAVCDHAITDRAYRTEMGGAHEHTFVNPSGFVHRVACFIAAPGCVHLGDTESAFSYFPGYTWQIAACGRCRAHLGWIYRCAGEQFHGLLVDALRP
ncbi:MAG: hypothetical protein KF773_40315 [Deltaproteobacteria bacterium]|nr:hypothetical protein [Deltaproteobacteria bacterium]